jgi:FMN reductase [NAD(P)H]
LNLPEYVFPISGLVVGYPRSVPAQKPRLPIMATLQKEQYDAKIQKEIIDQYDQTISSYMSERTSGNDTSDWSSKIAQFYDTGFDQYAKNSSPTVKNQRFRYK